MAHKTAPQYDPNFSFQRYGAIDPDDLRFPLYGATFPQAVSRFFKKFATFSGRASRSEFWWALAFYCLVQLVPGVIMVTATNTQVSLLGFAIMSVINLCLFVPYLALLCRRMHDGNSSGWFLLLTLIPGIGIFALLMTGIYPSKAEGQRFDA